MKAFRNHRNEGPGKALPILGLFFAMSFFTAASPLPSPSAGGGMEQNRKMVTVAPSPSPAPKLLSLVDARNLFKEFKKSQISELKALEHRQKLELKELKASQKVRLKEWEAKEKQERRKFFENNMKGSERRTYVKDFLERRNTFRQIQDDEYEQRKRSNEVRLESLREDQSERLKEFQSYLRNGEQPPSWLWPGPGR